MGKLTYNTTAMHTEIEDRALAHLQIVIVSKLRRKETFAFSWKAPMSEGDGRHVIWLAPEIPLHFQYYGGRAPAINTAWVHLLMASANSSSGLALLPEPHPPAT